MRKIGSLSISINYGLKPTPFAKNCQIALSGRNPFSKILYPRWLHLLPLRPSLGLFFYVNYGKNIPSKSNKEVLMRITTKGQVTIPMEIREKMGFLPDTEVEFVMEGNSVRLKRIERQSRRSRSLIARLRGKGTVKMTTDEIMALTRG